MKKNLSKQNPALNEKIIIWSLRKEYNLIIIDSVSANTETHLKRFFFQTYDSTLADFTVLHLWNYSVNKHLSHFLSLPVIRLSNVNEMMGKRKENLLSLFTSFQKFMQ